MQRDLFKKTDDLDALELATRFDVDTTDLKHAFQAAATFTRQVHGIAEGERAMPTEVCTLELPQDTRRITYSFDEDYEVDQQSLREMLRGPKGGGTCPSYVQLAYLTPDTTRLQRELFCLVYDEDNKLLGFDTGEQDAYGRCAEPSASFCERVNGSRETALAITGLAAGVSGATSAAAAATGTSVVLHSSGAAILTGGSGYIASTLGPLAATVGGLSAPATLTAASVTLVAVGGAVYLCQKED